jgi:hypothetical protein
LPLLVLTGFLSVLNSGFLESSDTGLLVSAQACFEREGCAGHLQVFSSRCRLSNMTRCGAAGMSDGS